MSVQAADPPALIVAGPTCSGKSALAIELAEQVRGTVINADSMQVYRELRVLTARPTPAEEASVPHALYGVRSAATASSVAWWREAALGAMAEARAQGRVPILCGGSGMYFAALTGGIAEIPDLGAEARAEARTLLAAIGPAALHARLHEVDPQTAARLRPSDSQRLARAWEVWRGTGVGLARWQARKPPPAPCRFWAVLLDPPRPALREAVAARFATMLDMGAVDEIEALLTLGLDPSLPAMRAHGVPELSAYLRGEVALAEAARRAIAATGQYARRQATWFRHHPLAPAQLSINARYGAGSQLSESLLRDLIQFVHGVG